MWEDRIIVDPEILVGKPVIIGTRLAVDFMLDFLAPGWSHEEMLRNYPGVTAEDIPPSVSGLRSRYGAQ